MKYNFDKEIDRRGTNSVKWDAMKAYFGSDDLQALWVADMDFETPDFIIDALKKRLDHPVLGYTTVPESYINSIINWQSRRNGWDIRKEWLAYIPGIVKGIGMALEVFTEPGDKVIVQPPIYHPFHLLPTRNGREVVWNPLIERDGGYDMDFEHLESVIEGCKVLILSNPHNPAGLVWDKETLTRLASICHKHGVLVISDEIHSDMPLFGHKHLPFASVSQEAAECSITFAAPSKTFNIAGVVSSYAVVPNDKLREKFFGWLHANEFASPHMFAPIATEAAFTYGEEWLEQMLAYLEENVLFVESFLAEKLPCVKPLRPQASFLVWLDCRELCCRLVGEGASDEQKRAALNDLFIKKAGLALNDGVGFGPGGSCFLRLNIGTTRARLATALESLVAAVEA
jgi:cystathionine beta-lyase